MTVGKNYQNTGRTTKNCRRHPDGVRCPFCGSSDTKFKFLNNRKAGQPRYQCSKCKQYWTEGGRIRGAYTGTEEMRNPVAADTTSQPSVSAVSTPTPSASNGSSMRDGLGGVSNTSPWDALLEVAKQCLKTEFPDLYQQIDD